VRPGRIASSAIDGHEQDLLQVPEPLSQIDQNIDRFIGGGIYVDLGRFEPYPVR
jgi:hypothetical protein